MNLFNEKIPSREFIKFFLFEKCRIFYNLIYYLYLGDVCNIRKVKRSEVIHRKTRVQ